jgi:hypothetical protein
MTEGPGSRLPAGWSPSIGAASLTLDSRDQFLIMQAYAGSVMAASEAPLGTTTHPCWPQSRIEKETA